MIKRLLLTTLFLTCILLSCYAQPGELDTLFNTTSAFNGEVKTIVQQPDGKILVGGNFTFHQWHPRNRIVRLNADGTLDRSFSIGTGFNNKVNVIKLQPDGKILVGGIFTSYKGTAAGKLIRLNADGTIDNTFTGPVSSSIVYSVNDIFVQQNGQIVIGGEFFKIRGTDVEHVARLNSDGSVDNTFIRGSFYMNYAEKIAVQDDGKIIVASDYSVSNLIRYNVNGTIDNTFIYHNSNNRVPGKVRFIEVLNDDRILIAGYFSYILVNNVANSNAKFLAILQPDGTIDNSFVADMTSVGNSSYIHSAALQGNKIVVAGHYSGSNNNLFLRFNMDGSSDNSFTPTLLSLAKDMEVNCIAVTNDESLLVGGYFTSPTNRYMMKLNPNGSLSNNFEPNKSCTPQIAAMTVLPNGKIMLAGSFTFINGSGTKFVVRLNADGSVDPAFQPDPNITEGEIRDMKIAPDGKIYLAGYIKANGSHYGIARLNSDGTVDGSYQHKPYNNNPIYRLLLQSNGKLIYLTDFNDPSSNIFRLNNNGSVDVSFWPSGKITGINTMHALDDNRILIARKHGASTPDDLMRRIMCLNPSEGTIDSSFVLTSVIDNIDNLYIASITSHNGFIYFNGYYSETCSGSCPFPIFCINTSGKKVASFSYTGDDWYSYSIAKDADGKILLGGGPMEDSPTNKNGIIRINPNGSVDNSFTSYTKIALTVSLIAIAHDGSILVAGNTVHPYSTYPQYAKVNNICRIKSNPVNYSTIRGTVFEDFNTDCIQNNEPVMQNAVVKAEPGPWYGSVQGNYYSIKVDAAVTTYSVSQVINTNRSEIITQVCPSNDHTATINGIGDNACCYNFGNSITSCAYLTIDISSDRRRRCIRNFTKVSYCNEGQLDQTNVQIKVLYPEYVIPLSSDRPWTTKIDSMLLYNIGILKAGECHSFTIVDSVACIPDITGFDQCTEAFITPVNNCSIPDPLWDRSDMSVEGECFQADAVFVIRNNGYDMNDSLLYRMYANDELILTKKYKLSSGSSLTLTLPAEGDVIRIEVDQHAKHPRKRMAIESVYACGADLSSAQYGFISSYSQEDGDVESAISCLPIVDSFDPNDKQVFPEGLTNDHNILPGTPVEYTIRFENTGTDVAYRVIIVDTLEASLNIESLELLSASHPYSFTVSGKGRPVLTWVFSQIDLTPTSVNSSKSSGYIRFRIAPYISLPEGSIIRNNASIYFDFNAPVITNTVLNTITTAVEENTPRGEGVTSFVTTDIISSDTEGSSVTISPNPFSEFTEIKLGDLSIFNASISIYDLHGKEVKKDYFQGDSYRLDRGNLVSGIYFYKIYNQHGVVVNGKLCVR